MPFEDTDAALRDILEAILSVERFVNETHFEEFLWDEKTRSAVERKLLIISEAAIRLGDKAEQLCPGIPWRDVRGIGNWLRHQYDRVDVETVWNTVQDDLPRLKVAVQSVLGPS
jgi:uncharacterized protein with HEPN domain